MVVAKRVFNLNSLQSSDEASLVNQRVSPATSHRAIIIGST